MAPPTRPPGDRDDGSGEGATGDGGARTAAERAVAEHGRVGALARAAPDAVDRLRAEFEDEPAGIGFLLASVATAVGMGVLMIGGHALPAAALAVLYGAAAVPTLARHDAHDVFSPEANPYLDDPED